MSRLRLTFREFTNIIESHGFVLERQEGSHKHYRCGEGPVVRLVTVAGHRGIDVIKPGTLTSMIRQSGLSKAAFRK